MAPPPLRPSGNGTSNAQTVKQVQFAFSLDQPNSPPISNEEFLESYVRMGAWLRLVQIQEQLNLIRGPIEPIRRLAAIASIYHALGALVEDVSATLISWMAWNRFPELLLADVLANTSFIRDDKIEPSLEYIATFLTQLGAGKRVRVDSQVLVKALSRAGAVAALAMMGIAWKPIPSVKVARGDELIFWSKLPDAFGEILEFMAEPSTLMVCLSHNKIKHGPQVVMADMLSQLRAMGADAAMIEQTQAKIRSRGLTPETLRILFRGAQTRGNPSAGDLPTLWLDDDLVAMESLIGLQFYNLGKVPWLVAMWLRKIRFGKSWIAPPKTIIEFEATVLEIRARNRARLAVLEASMSSKS